MDRPTFKKKTPADKKFDLTRYTYDQALEQYVGVRRHRDEQATELYRDITANKVEIDTMMVHIRSFEKISSRLTDSENEKYQLMITKNNELIEEYQALMKKYEANLFNTNPANPEDRPPMVQAVTEGYYRRPNWWSKRNPWATGREARRTAELALLEAFTQVKTLRKALEDFSPHIKNCIQQQTQIDHNRQAHNFNSSTQIDHEEYFGLQRRAQELESRLRTERKSANELESRLQTQRERANELESRLQTQRERANELESRLQTQRERADELEDEFREEQARADGLQSQLQAQPQQARVDELKRLLRIEQAGARDLDKQLQTRYLTIQQQQNQLKELQERVEELQERVEELQKELQKELSTQQKRKRLQIQRASEQERLSKLSDSKQSKLLDIPRRYFPTTFEVGLEDPQKLSREDTIELLATSIALDGKKVAILYDVDYTLVDPRFPLSKFQEEWIDALEIFQELQAHIGVITGRHIEYIQDFFDRSPKSRKLVPNIHMFGERGDVYKGPLSNGKKVLIDKELKKYVPLVEGIYNDITDEIKRNDVLTGYMAKNLIPQGVGIRIESLGLSTLIEDTELFLKEHRIDENDAKIVLRALTGEMRNIIPRVLKNYSDFEQEEKQEIGFFIRLKESAAGQKLGKGAALQDLVDAYKLESVFTIGDGLVDVDAEKQAKQLLDINRFIDTYVEELPTRKFDFFEHFSKSIERYKAAETGKAEEAKTGRYEFDLEDDKVQKQMEARIDVHEALLKINKRALKRSGMIGVGRPKDVAGSPEVAKKSMYMATGIEDIAHLSYQIALRAREIRSQHRTDLQ